MVNADLIISDEDVWKSYIKQHVNYTIDGVHITTNTVKDDVEEPTEEELFEKYTDDIDDFYREEMRNLEIVSWEKSHLAMILVAWLMSASKLLIN